MQFLQVIQFSLFLHQLLKSDDICRLQMHGPVIDTVCLDFYDCLLQCFFPFLFGRQLLDLRMKQRSCFPVFFFLCKMIQDLGGI